MAIRPDQNNLDEFVQLPAGIIPANLNKEFWIARTNDILGGPKLYSTLEDFMNLHPNLMEKGMSVTVNEHSRDNKLFPTTEYTLKKIPLLSDYPLEISPNQLDEFGNLVLVNGDPVPNTNFYLNFWELDKEFTTGSIEPVLQYAPDINGIKPPYPYIDNPSAESSWVDTYIPGEHKWYRQRSNDEIDVGTGIYKNWTIPFSINGNFASGDYVENKFIRSATIPKLPSRYTKDGLPNNNPSGWTDVPPVGTSPLYEIRTQKNKYGDLKDDWLGPFLIPEDEDIIRYNSQSFPNPNTIVGINTSSAAATQADTDLIAVGWVKSFDPNIHVYRASRTKNGVNDYTQWKLDKISEESGEYIDRIYKLFPINQDADDATFIANNTPVGNDPISNVQNLTKNEGWSDTQLTETSTHINFTSQARKFIDGSLKTPWSSPKPFTGKDTYQDIIVSNNSNNFKYKSSTDNSPDPASIDLTAKLFKGVSEITTGLTYRWHKIYNNKVAITEDINNPLATTKTITVLPADVATKAIFKCYITLTVTGGTDLIFSEEYSITDITDGDDAKSLVLSSATPIVLYDTTNNNFSIDTIELRAFQNFLDGVTTYWYFDDGAGNWVSVTQFASGSITSVADATGGIVTISSNGHGLTNGEQVNITGTTSYNGNYEISNVTANTFDITATFVATETGAWNQNFYTVNGLVLTVSTDNIFKQDGVKESKRFIVSTSSSASTADDVAFNFDIKTISKLSSAGVGTPGEDAITINLSNEVDSVILDRGTGLPQSGEIAITTPVTYPDDYGRVKSKITVYNGTTKLIHGTDWTITNIVSDTTNVTFDQISDGQDRVIYISSWTNSTARKVNATMTINVVGVGNLVKNFTVASTLDDAGAIIPFIQIASDSVNKGLSFTPSERNDIKLEAILDQNGTKILSSDFDGNVVWKFNNIQTNTNLTGTNLNFKTVKRVDVVNNTTVTAVITYNGKSYTTIPVSIEDITDNKNYRLFYNFAVGYDVEANEPLSLPAVPADVTVTNFESTFPVSGASSGWYREPNQYTYFKTDSIVNPVSGVDTISFTGAYRTKGEKGIQGITPNFTSTYYLATESSTLPTVTANATRNDLFALGWRPIASQVTGTFLYEALNNFSGSDVDNLDAIPLGNWTIIKKQGIAGIDGDRGWSPDIRLETRGSDGKTVFARYWIDGEGSKPSNEPLYLKNDGTFVSDVNNAYAFLLNGLKHVDMFYLQFGANLVNDPVGTIYLINSGNQNTNFLETIAIDNGSFEYYDTDDDGGITKIPLNTRVYGNEGSIAIKSSSTKITFIRRMFYIRTNDTGSLGNGLTYERWVTKQGNIVAFTINITGTLSSGSTYPVDKQIPGQLPFEFRPIGQDNDQEDTTNDMVIVHPHLDVSAFGNMYINIPTSGIFTISGSYLARGDQKSLYLT